MKTNTNFLKWVWQNAYGVANFIVAPAFIALAIYFSLNPDYDYPNLHAYLAAFLLVVILVVFPIIRKEGIEHFHKIFNEGLISMPHWKLSKWYFKTGKAQLKKFN